MCQIMYHMGTQDYMPDRFSAHTNNLPCIIVAEKLGHDLMNEDIKGQLAYMSQFVNVSSEMYHAIKMENIDEAN